MDQGTLKDTRGKTWYFKNYQFLVWYDPLDDESQQGLHMIPRVPFHIASRSRSPLQPISRMLLAVIIFLHSPLFH